MIDLKNNPSVPENAEAQPTLKSKHNTKKEANAKKFLCVMLALIVGFISVICIFAGKRNADIAAQQKIDAAEAEKNKTTLSQNPDTTGSKKEETKAETSNQTEADTTAEPAVTAGVTTAQPGTFKNPTIIDIDSENWHLTLVNTGYRISDTYEPDLVYVCGSGERLDKKVAEHYEKMFNAAQKDGVNLTPCSGYRSYETQEINYNRKIDYFVSQGFTKEESKVKAATIIMPPGSSEHNLGYAMDIVCVEEWFETTDEFKWLQKNAADYGFILRYPKEKQDITNVIYEPWHWRYVGVEHAKNIKESDLVLEEYLGG